MKGICFTYSDKMAQRIESRSVQRPTYIASCSFGKDSIAPDDSPEMKRVKEFCILYGIVDITMRMLRIPEMKRIQGFGDDYVLKGTKAEQTKFIGNAVEVSQATAICVATAQALQQATTTTCHANTPFHGK